MAVFIAIVAIWFAISLVLASIVGRVIKAGDEPTSASDDRGHNSDTQQPRLAA